MKKRNPQDATLRNIRALKARVAALDGRLRGVERRRSGPQPTGKYRDRLFHAAVRLLDANGHRGRNIRGDSDFYAAVDAVIEEMAETKRGMTR